MQIIFKKDINKNILWNNSTYNSNINIIKYLLILQKSIYCIYIPIVVKVYLEYYWCIKNNIK